MADSILIEMLKTSINRGFAWIENVGKVTLKYNGCNCSAHPERNVVLTYKGETDEQKADSILEELKKFLDEFNVSTLVYKGLDSSGHSKSDGKTPLADVLEEVGIFRQCLCGLYAELENLRKQKTEFTSFVNDKEKMADFFYLNESEFMASYSYLTSKEYMMTYNEVRSKILSTAEMEMKEFRRYASSGTPEEALDFAYELAIKDMYLNILSNRELDAYVYGYLYDTDSPLDRMYQDWLGSDDGVEDELLESVENKIEHSWT